MTMEMIEALRMLEAHRTKWVRPGGNVRLLAYLILAVRGLAVATEDESGFRFRLAPVRQVAA